MKSQVIVKSSKSDNSEYVWYMVSEKVLWMPNWKLYHTRFLPLPLVPELATAVLSNSQWSVNSCSNQIAAKVVRVTDKISSCLQAGTITAVILRCEDAKERRGQSSLLKPIYLQSSLSSGTLRMVGILTALELVKKEKVNEQRSLWVLLMWRLHF